MPSRALLYGLVGVAAIATLLFWPDSNGYSLADDLGILGNSTAGGQYIPYHIENAALPVLAVVIGGVLVLHFLVK